MSVTFCNKRINEGVAFFSILAFCYNNWIVSFETQLCVEEQKSSFKIRKKKIVHRCNVDKRILLD